MIAEIQVAPSPPGTADNPHAHVEAAIAVIQASGLRYEVGALGTTLEGEDDAVWATLRAAHEAMLAAGATGGISHVKIASVNRTIDSLTGKFRLMTLSISGSHRGHVPFPAASLSRCVAPARTASGAHSAQLSATRSPFRQAPVSCR